MKHFIIGILVAFGLSVHFVDAADRPEKATYVGGGRYVGEGDSVPDAVIRQRSNEYSERERDRQDSQRQYDRNQRRDRDDGYDRADRDY